MALLSAFPVTNILGSASTSNPVYVTPTSSVSTTGSNITLTADYKTAGFFLNVVQTSGATSHSLDVYVQHSPDGGTTFDDFVHFPTINSSSPNANVAYKSYAVWLRDVAPTSSNQIVHTPATQTLAANTVLFGPVGAVWRGVAVVNMASGTTPWKLNLTAQVAQ